MCKALIVISNFNIIETRVGPYDLRTVEGSGMLERRLKSVDLERNISGVGGSLGRI